MDIRMPCDKSSDCNARPATGSRVDRIGASGDDGQAASAEGARGLQSGEPDQTNDSATRAHQRPPRGALLAALRALLAMAPPPPAPLGCTLLAEFTFLAIPSAIPRLAPLSPPPLFSPRAHARVLRMRSSLTNKREHGGETARSPARSGRFQKRGTADAHDGGERGRQEEHTSTIQQRADGGAGASECAAATRSGVLQRQGGRAMLGARAS